MLLPRLPPPGALLPILTISIPGPTAGNHADNLQPLCARHHHLKHEAGWSVRREPDGTTTWTSPTGHTYTRPPDELPTDTTSDPPGDAA